jgi:pentatricopeptide repeat domain-containing protein 1
MAFRCAGVRSQFLSLPVGVVSTAGKRARVPRAAHGGREFCCCTPPFLHHAHAAAPKCAQSGGRILYTPHAAITPGFPTFPRRFGHAAPSDSVFDLPAQVLACDSLEDAGEVFNGMLVRGLGIGVETYNAMLSQCARHGNANAALHLFAEMKGGEVVPNGTTYDLVLSACRKCGSRPDDVIAVYQEMVKDAQWAPSVLAYKAYTAACQKTNRQPDLQAAAYEPNLIVYNAVIAACGGEDSNRSEALALFQELKTAGLAPNAGTFKALLGALTEGLNGASPNDRQQTLDEAFGAFDELQSSGLQVDAAVYKAMISICAKCGRPDAAFAMFGEMKEADIAASVDVGLYNSLISACKRVDQVSHALLEEVASDMKKNGVQPNLRTFNELISAYKKTKAPEDAFRILGGMKSAGVAGDIVTYSALIAACDTKNGMDLYAKGVALLQEMKDEGVRPSARTYTPLISMCGKRGLVDDAFVFFDEMKASGVVLDTNSYNAIISACTRNRKMESANDMLAEMKNSNLKPDFISYTTLITAYANDSVVWQSENLGAVGSRRQKSNMLEAFALLNEMKSMGLEPNLNVYRALIDLCVKSGRFDRVKHIIDMMKKSNNYKEWLARHHPRG